MMGVATTQSDYRSVGQKRQFTEAFALKRPRNAACRCFRGIGKILQYEQLIHF